MALSCTMPGCSEQLVDDFATECPLGHEFDPDAATELPMQAVPPPAEAAGVESTAERPRIGRGLVVKVGGRRAWGAAPLLLGRSPSSPVAHLFQNYDNVSREHARISIAGTELEIRDRGSKNGTFIRSRRIQFERVPDGEQLQLARNCFVELTIDDTPPSAYPA